MSDFLFVRCVLSYLLPLRSVGRSNLDKGLHNLVTLIQKRHKIIKKMKFLYYIMESSVDSFEKRNTIYIYMCVTLGNTIRDPIRIWIFYRVHWSILVMLLVCRFLDTEVDGSIPGISMLYPRARHFIRHQYVVSTSKALYPASVCCIHEQGTLSGISMLYPRARHFIRHQYVVSTSKALYPASVCCIHEQGTLSGISMLYPRARHFIRHQYVVSTSKALYPASVCCIHEQGTLSGISMLYPRARHFIRHQYVVSTTLSGISMLYPRARHFIRHQYVVSTSKALYPASVCCIHEQGTLSSLLQSTQL